MRDGSLARCQLSRLIRILLELQRGAFPNAIELGDWLGVSVRTVHRDLNALRQAGIPVRFCPNRMGYGFAASFRVEPPALEREEIASIAWLTLGARGLAGRLVDAQAWAGLLKLVEAAQPADRRVLRGLLALIEPVADSPHPEPLPANRTVPLPNPRPIRVRLSGEADASCLVPQALSGEAGRISLVGRAPDEPRRTVSIPIAAIEAVEPIPESA